MENIQLLEAKKLSPHEILLKWSDGHEAPYRSSFIRKNCRCAYCVDELTGRILLDPNTIPDDLKIEKISLMGRYALTFDFSDFHETGIYPFPLLRSICPCEQHQAIKNKGINPGQTQDLSQRQGK